MTVPRDPVVVRPGEVTRGHAESTGYGRDRPTRPRLVTDRKPRCRHCNAVIAWYATRPWSIQCRHCANTTNRE